MAWMTCRDSYLDSIEIRRKRPVRTWLGLHYPHNRRRQNAPSRLAEI